MTRKDRHEIERDDQDQGQKIEGGQKGLDEHVMKERPLLNGKMKVTGDVHQGQALDEKAEEEGPDEAVEEQPVQGLHRGTIEDPLEHHRQHEAQKKARAQQIQEEKAHDDVHRHVLFEHGVPEAFLPLMSDQLAVELQLLHSPFKDRDQKKPFFNKEAFGNVHGLNPKMVPSSLSASSYGSALKSILCIPPLLLLLIGCNGIGESLPEGKSGQKADRAARRMLDAIEHEAWDRTRYVRWRFLGQSYLWDKDRELVDVRWSDKQVLMDLHDRSGKAYEDGERLRGEEKEEALQEAWSKFCNDSFWLNAPAKVFDPGTQRELVKSDSEETRLLVTYTSGGVTPGDSYLWILDANGRPERYKMWVSKIPIGGVEASWEEWDTLSTGALIATKHELFIGSLSIGGAKAAQDLEELGIENDPFRDLD